MVKELVIISGKGGTGKTSVTASFAALAENAVLADCDVDAADLHLVLEPAVQRREDFSGGKQAVVNPEACVGCGKCMTVCQFDAISQTGPGNPWLDNTYLIDQVACEGCGVCAWFCPQQCIALTPAINGEWYVSETRHGPMVHAKLGIAEENSGKLVSTVREEAGKIARSQQRDLVLIDGSPGTGCPVIASITGADLVLIVTEPTLSGLHDLERVASVAAHFQIPALVCVNKWDINPEVTEQIETLADQHGVTVVGRIRYDRAVTVAQIRKQSVVEYADNGCAQDMRDVWTRTLKALQKLTEQG